MLVLTRKAEESIRIGKNIVITVVECRNGHVKLGINAPKNIPVHREEIYKRITNRNQESVFNKNALNSILNSFKPKK